MVAVAGAFDDLATGEVASANIASAQIPPTKEKGATFRSNRTVNASTRGATNVPRSRMCDAPATSQVVNVVGGSGERRATGLDPAGGMR